MVKCYYFYILKCNDESLYGGYTTQIVRRVAQHNAGKGAKYTRSHRPVKLIYAHCFFDKSTALRAEAKFKQLSRLHKLEFLAKHGIKIV